MAKTLPPGVHDADLQSIVRQTWLFVDDPYLVESDDFHVMLENGAILSVHINADRTVARETITEPASWLVPGLPPAPIYLNADGMGGIVCTMQNAHRLREFTTLTHERISDHG